MEGGLSGDDPREHSEKLNPREGKETLEDIDRGVSETIREIAGPEEAREMEAEAEKLEDYDEEKRIDEGIDGAIRDTVGEDEANETQEELEEADDSNIDEGVGQAIRDTAGEKEASERDEEGERLDEEVTDEKIEEVIEETLEERDQEKIGEEVEQIIEEVEQEAADGSNEEVGEGDEGREQGDDIGDEEIEEPPDPELDPLEEKVLESFEERGIDKEEVRERMEERFRKDVEDLLEEENDLDEETRVQEEEGTEERTAAGQGAHIETGDGTVQVMDMPFDEGTDGSATQEAKTVEEIPVERGEEETAESSEVEESEEAAEASEEKEDLSETHSVEKEVKEEAADTQAAEVDEEIEPEKAREEQGEGIRKEEATDSKSDGEISESAEGEKLEQYAQEVAEEQREGSERKEEGKEQDEGEEGAEGERRESLYVPRRRISLAGNEGLVNPAERQLENPYADPEEEHRKWLREMYRAFPEGLRKRLREIGKKRPVDKEDYEKLLKRYGPELEDIPGIEEMKEEGYEYYRFKEALKQLEGEDVDIEEVANRAGIPVEQAREYGNGKVAPIVTALQNYETLMLGSGKDVHEIAEMVREHPDVAEDSLSEQEMEELQVWIDIMEAKEREDIEFCVRVGREVFRKDQVVELAKTHGLEVEVVLSWLWELERPVGALKLESLLYSITEETEYVGGEEWDEGIVETGAPSKEFLENFPQCRRDYDWMISRHSYLKEFKIFETAYEQGLIYIELKARQRRGELDGISQRELSRQYGVSYNTIAKWLDGSRMARLVEMLLLSEELRRGYEEKELGTKALQNRISPAVLYWVFEDFRGWKEIPVEVLTDCVLRLYRLAGEPIGVRFADFRIPHKTAGKWLNNVADMLKEKQAEVEKDLNKRLGLDINSDIQLRVGVADSKLYFRMHDRHWRNWFNLYKNGLFYFKSTEDKAALICETYEGLGSLGGTYFSRLVEQMTDFGTVAKGAHRNSDLNTKSKHLRGETLHLILDVNRLRIQDIQHQIHHVGRTREGKSGTILNPRFPADPEMVDIILARIVGAAMSDGHIARKGKGFLYYEKYDARVKIFLDYMSALGDIQYNDNDKENGIWKIRFPTVVGRMLERVGVTAGDSCIQNNGLPEFVLKGSLRVKCVYLSQLWVEDGCFSKSRRNPYPAFLWKRTVVLYDVSKAHMYDVKGEIGKNLIYLFNEHGDEKESATPGKSPDIFISRKKLQGLRRHENPEIASAADKLWKLANCSESKLLNDEIKILEDLGVSIDPRLIRVTYYEDSGRISAEWAGRVFNPEDVMLICLLAPPDDKRKRESVEEWVKSEPLLEKKVLGQIEDEGLKWIMEEQKRDDQDGGM
jgi:transcriptional regulator with XRE-family HTH domain